MSNLSALAVSATGIENRFANLLQTVVNSQYLYKVLKLLNLRTEVQ